MPSADDARNGSDSAVVEDSSPARLGRISIGAILWLLMAAIIVPALIFSVVLLQRNNQAQQTMVTTLAEATAGSVAETVDRQLTGMLTTLRVLATSRAMERGNLFEHASNL